MKKNISLIIILLLVGCSDTSTISSVFSSHLSVEESVSINSTLSLLDDGKVLKEEALNSLKSSIEIKTTEYCIELATNTREIEQVFTKDALYMYEESETYVSKGVLIKEDGLLKVQTLNQHNEVVTEVVDEDFDISNPFLNLTLNDFTYISDYHFALSKEKAEQVIPLLTMYVQESDNFEIVVENNKVVELNYMVHNSYKEYFSYSSIISSHNVAKIPSIQYEKENHQELKNALNKLNENYTILRTNVENGVEENTTIKRDKNIYLFSDNSGYYKKDNTYYSFDVVDGVAINKKEDPLTLDSHFLDVNFSMDFFKKVENNTYVPKDKMALFIVDVLLGATKRDSLIFDYFSSELTITLSNGNIESINVISDMYGQIIETNYLFKDIGETTLDIDVTNII